MAYFQEEAALEKGNVSFFFYFRNRTDIYVFRGGSTRPRIFD